MEEFIMHCASSKVGLGKTFVNMFGLHGMEGIQVLVFNEGILTTYLHSSLDVFI